MEIFRNSNQSAKNSKILENFTFSVSPKSSTHVGSCFSPNLIAKSRDLSLKKKPKSFISNETQKLEEDFSVGLIQLKQRLLVERGEYNVKAEEVKLHEKVIENGLLFVQLIDKQLGSFLLRTWKSFRKFDFESTSKTQKIFIEKATNVKTEMKDFCVQCEMSEESENLDSYIEHLNRAILRVDFMNHEKLVITLQKLLLKLYESDELGLDESGSYEEDINTIFIRNKEIALRPTIQVKTETIKPKLKMPPLMTEKVTQTIEKLEDEASRQYMIKLLIEKENKAFLLNKELKRFVNLEADFNKTRIELKVCQKVIQEIFNSSCTNCKEQVKKIQFNNKNLSVVTKNIEKEEADQLALKKAYEDYKAEVEKNLITIKELDQNLQLLNKRIQEIRAKKKILKEKLKEQENLRNNAELRYKELIIERQSFRNPSIVRKESIKMAINSKTPLLTTQKTSSVIKDDSRAAYSRKVLDYDSSSHSSFEENQMTQTVFVKSSKPDVYRSEIPKSKFRVIRTKFQASEEFRPKSSSATKINKKSDILKILKISKEEYLGLSTHIRAELYECLFEHKSKCGADCEHLRRAAEIRLKQRGCPFPLKKFNL